MNTFMTLALVYVQFIFLKTNFDVFRACDTDIKTLAGFYHTLKEKSAVPVPWEK